MLGDAGIHLSYDGETTLNAVGIQLTMAIR